MRLHSFRVHNYRRFAGTHTLNIDEPVVALVGPNEAGKSSLLEALTILHTAMKFPISSLTRGVDASADPATVEYKFILEDEDFEDCADFDVADPPKWLLIEISSDRTSKVSVEPLPRKNYRPIGRTTQRIDQALAECVRHLKNQGAEHNRIMSSAFLERLRKALNALTPIAVDQRANEKQEHFALARLEEVLTHIKASNEDLRDEESSAPPGSESSLGRWPIETLTSLTQELMAARDLLKAESPNDAIRKRLLRRTPNVTMFSDADRDLPSQHNLEEEEVPQGLSNLLRMAGVSLLALRNAVGVGDYLEVQEILDAGNTRLTESLAVWRQEDIRVKILVHDHVLRIIVSSTGGSYTDFDSRSDGLRQFVALIAAVYARSQRDRKGKSRESIVLIDEAENHLHYDAQADLIEVFTRQEFAKQIVYTTHSAGCLPEDLGTGIRAIRPIPETGRSEIKNWFWAEGVGATPILLALGAGSLAFSSLRRVVLTEGATEMILLPALIREATGHKVLGYQVAPGTSEVSASAVDQLDLEAARTCFLVDGDPGGEALANKLCKNGIDATRIVILGDRGSGVSLEDLIDEKVYLECFRQALPTDVDVAALFGDLSLPPKNRSRTLRELCKHAKVSEPSKRVVAQIMARKAKSSHVLSEDGADLVRKAHEQLSSILG